MEKKREQGTCKEMNCSAKQWQQESKKQTPVSRSAFYNESQLTVQGDSLITLLTLAFPDVYFEGQTLHTCLLSYPCMKPLKPKPNTFK